MKIGVVGYGYWGPNLVRNFLGIEGVSGVSIADLNPKRLKIASMRHSGCFLTTNYDDLLKDADIEAIAISTPVDSHYVLAKQALLAGKHVLVEKPLASSVSQARELWELALKKNRTLMVDHTFVYTGAVRKIKEIISGGTIGDPIYYDSARVNLGLFQHDVNVIWDLAPHDISIIDFLFDLNEAEVSALGSCYKSMNEAISYVTIYLDNGLIAHLNVSWLSPVKVRTVMIGGTDKMIVYNDVEPTEKVKIYDRGVDLIDDQEELYKIWWQYRVGDIYVPKIDHTEALYFELKHFIDCISNNKLPLTNGECGSRVVAILEAASQSLQSGNKVRVKF